MDQTIMRAFRVVQPVGAGSKNTCEWLLWHITLALYRLEHQAANQSAERPDKEPVRSELNSAGRVPTNNTRFRGQDGSLWSDRLHMEVPDGARKSCGYWAVEIPYVKRQDIACRPPKFPRDAEHDFPPRFLLQLSESEINQCLHRNFSTVVSRLRMPRVQ